MAVKEIEERRFLALAGYTRDYRTLAFVEERGWFETDDGRVLGVLFRDRYDHDFAWTALGRDERGRFRSIDLGVSLNTLADARAALEVSMARWQVGSDEDMHQGVDDEDEEIVPPVDFFAPITPEAQQHPSFRTLVSDPRYSPARELIAAMMRYHDDVDGNFVQQFQTVAFDARLWELYLFAAFTEIGFARIGELPAPDFVMISLRGGLGVEATTANPPQDAPAPQPTTRDEAVAHMENYVPIKLARALKKKLRKNPPYWTAEGMDGLPFVIALQDFHAPAAMTRIVMPATEYAFGVRHSRDENGLKVEWIDAHRVGEMSEPSGFFKLTNAENVSAVIINPLGTLTKFNRLGLLAGFGDPRVRMVRTGLRRFDGDQDPRPRLFEEAVHAPGYRETWVEGMVVLHNPNARISLDREIVSGASHEYLQADGTIMTGLPDDPPVSSSRTRVYLEGEDIDEARAEKD